MPRGGSHGSRSHGSHSSHSHSFGSHSRSIGHHHHFGGSHFGHSHFHSRFGSSFSSRRPGHVYGARSRFSSGGGGFGGVRRVYAVPNVPSPFFAPGQLNFRGNIMTLRQQFEQLNMEQRNSIVSVTIAIPGTQVQEQSTCCKITTLAFSFLIFPLCIMCCNCYKACTEPLFTLTEADYQGIAQVIRECRSVQAIRIFVQDNYITAQKTKIIEDTIAMLGVPLSRFTFQNCAMGLNVNQDEYDNFDSLFSTLKDNQSILVSILWDDQLFMTQNYQPKVAPGMPGMMPNPQLMMMGNPQMLNPQMMGQQPVNPQMINPQMMAQMMSPTNGQVMTTEMSMNQPANQQPNPYLISFWDSNPFNVDQKEQALNTSINAIYPQ